MLRKQTDESNTNPGQEPRVFQSDPKLQELAKKAAEFKVDPFLSDSELYLTERQRTALIKTLDLMESGGISDHKMIDGRTFSMNYWVQGIHHCGTVCCIGGTASLLDADRTSGGYTSIFHLPGCYGKSGLSHGGEALANLFYNWGLVHVSVKRAAAQLRHYLETGKCKAAWAERSKP